MKNALDIALIGIGRWGANLLRVLLGMPGVRVAAICDVNPSRLLEVSQFQNVGDPLFTTNSDEALSAHGLDAAVIAAPSEVHACLGAAALRAGLDVFVEKPLATSLAEGQLLIREAEAQKRILMVGHILEHHPVLRILRGVVASGALGQIDSILSERHGCESANAWWSLAPHDLGIARGLLGPALSISARRAFQDGVSVELEMSRGSSRIHVSGAARIKTRRLTICGQKVAAVFDDLAQQRLRFESRVGQLPPSPANSRLLAAAQLNATTNGTSEPLRAELEAFVESILTRTTPATDGEYGMQVLELLEAGDRSLALGGVPIRVQSRRPLNSRDSIAHVLETAIEPAQ